MSISDYLVHHHSREGSTDLDAFIFAAWWAEKDEHKAGRNGHFSDISDLSRLGQTHER